MSRLVYYFKCIKVVALYGELFHFADQIFIPVLMIVGSKDTGTPPSN